MTKNRIRDLREDSDLKQSELAGILNCAQTCLSKWELKQRDVPNDVLIELANYFNTSADYILGITDAREPYPRAKIST